MGVLLKPSELLKARKLPEGTIRDWKGRKYKKTAGKWMPYSEGGRKGTAPKKKTERKSTLSDFDVDRMTEKQMDDLQSGKRSGRDIKQENNFRYDDIPTMKADLKSGELKKEKISEALDYIAKDRKLDRSFVQRVWDKAAGKGAVLKATATVENAKKVLQKNPASIFALEDLAQFEDPEDAKEDYNLSDEQVAALGAVTAHVKVKTESGNIPKGMKYFRLSTSDGYPVLTVSDIKGFEKMFDWSV